eukprot:2689996-Heterocapsa_arctica.AAC.1
MWQAAVGAAVSGSGDWSRADADGRRPGRVLPLPGEARAVPSADAGCPSSRSRVPHGDPGRWSRGVGVRRLQAPVNGRGLC